MTAEDAPFAQAQQKPNHGRTIRNKPIALSLRGLYLVDLRLYRSPIEEARDWNLNPSQIILIK